MLINIGGRFKIEDYIADKNKVTLITNIKPDFDILLGNETTSEINEFYNK